MNPIFLTIRQVDSFFERMPEFFASKHGTGVSLTAEDDAQVLACGTQEALKDPRLSKVALVDLGLDGNRPSTSKGFFFECKVEVCLSGYLTSLGLGFSTIGGADACAEEVELPRRAVDMDETLMIGYSGTERKRLN